MFKFFLGLESPINGLTNEESAEILEQELDGLTEAITSHHQSSCENNLNSEINNSPLG